MRNYIVFAGKSLKDFGVYISGPGIFDAPERDTKSVAIPGRNGELTLDNGRYKNQKGKFPAFIVKKLAKNAEGLRNYVLGLSGFQRFEDTYNPDEYRMAKYSGGFKFNPLDELKEAKFDLNFEFYPQRFLKIGEEYISLANGSSILNPTLMTAKPLIKMTTTSEGAHKFTLGDIEVACTKNSSVIFIDCEQEEAWDDSLVNMNSYITLTHGVFPYLPAGETGLTTTNCTIEIMPRWWRL